MKNKLTVLFLSSHLLFVNSDVEVGNRRRGDRATHLGVFGKVSGEDKAANQQIPEELM
jgi:hypothetical protein